MLIQHWTLLVGDSGWLKMLRIYVALGMVICAGWIVAFVVGVVGIGGWWGDWVWPWPVLLYLSWVVAYQPAPLLPAMQILILTETGGLGDHQIRHSLRTPWLLALQLSPALSTNQRGMQTILQQPQWIWVVRDQLSAESWVRLNRVCQNTSTDAAPAA